MAITSFRELRVYQRNVDLRKRVFALSKTWPKEERYSLTDQVRRSSRSVGANLAEAWAKRRYRNHFICKLTDAHAEAEETSVWLDVAQECKYLDDEEHLALRALCDEIGGGLVKMMRGPEQWCGPATLVREELAAYETD